MAPGQAQCQVLGAGPDLRRSVLGTSFLPEFARTGMSEPQAPGRARSIPNWIQQVRRWR